MAPAIRAKDVFGLPGFLGFWLADTVSTFGSQVTGLALQVLVVVTLRGSAADVGLLNASRWAPYLLFGLVMGALVDRRRRRPLLVATDLVRALVLGAIPTLWLLGWLSLPVLMAFVAAFGLLTLVNDAAAQSFLPRLVPPPALLAANARLDQGGAAAQTAGPLLAGSLITLLGAPLAVLVDAASYLFSAVMLAGLRVTEPPPADGPKTPLLGEVSDGLRWIYRHPTLAPMALSTHAWFIFNSMLGAILVPFALRGLGLRAVELGFALAAAGAASLVGAVLATRLGRRWGAGPAVIGCRLLYPLGCAIIALTPTVLGRAVAVAVLALGQAVCGFALGAENANEMAYRQAVTPDALQSRVNTSMRSLNRAMVVVAAPLGGLLADRIGYRPTLWITAAGFLLVPLALAATPFRHARHGEGLA